MNTIYVSDDQMLEVSNSVCNPSLHDDICYPGKEEYGIVAEDYHGFKAGDAIRVRVISMHWSEVLEVNGNPWWAETWNANPNIPRKLYYTAHTETL